MSRPKSVRVFFAAGEPSGDLHGANLIRALRARCDRFEAVGYGGPQMALAGCRLHADLTQLAVMWFARAMANLHRFWDLASRADRYFRHHRPDAVVLVDYPGFNWWIAGRAKAHGIPVFYYTPPQIWAWATWRVGKMRRLVDHVLCSLPFEEQWLRERGCNTTLVGHPFFDEIERRQLDAEFIHKQRQHEGPLLLILPGSRTQEVERNLSPFLRAAVRVRRAVPDVRLVVAPFKPRHAERVRRALAARDLQAEVHVGRNAELMHLADCCMACSGSVSLELLCQTTPTVILYQISRLALCVQHFFRDVKYITLVNLLAADDPFARDLALFDPSQPGADRVPFPEYLTCEDRSAQIATHVIEWLIDPAKRQQRVAELARLRDRVAQPGAAGRAADYILRALSERPAHVPKPHFAARRCAVAR
jgi:lipid-A-disaccharide synthase